MGAQATKPSPLKSGDRIAVVAPSGGYEPSRLEAGVGVLERRGFRVSLPGKREAYRVFSGSDEERRAELVQAFEAPDVRAVWFARGGYGMNRILPALEASWLLRHPKICIGFSDATALLQWLVRSGVPAIHGPMVAHDLVREDAAGGLDHLLAIAAGSELWEVPVPVTLVSGSVEAPLTGGCLAVLASLAGTPFAPRFAGSIALLEDTHERPQRKLDRMLIQLRQSGALDGVAGILFGTMPECGPAHEVHETILDCLGDLSVPIGFGAPVGHGERHLAVPFGVRVRLSVEGQAGGNLTGLESLVV